MNIQKTDRITFKHRSLFLTILFTVLLLTVTAGTASAITNATGGSIAPSAIKAASPPTGIIGLNLSSDSGDILTSLNLDFSASGPGFDINDLNPLSNDPTSGVSLYFDRDGDGQFSYLSDEQVPLLFPGSVFAPPICSLTIDPAYASIHPLPASSDIYNYFVVIRTSSGISNGDIIAASIIAPDSIITIPGPTLPFEPIMPVPIFADTISPELVCAKYISSTELEITFNENISSVDKSKISLTDDNNDPILLTGDPVLIEDNLVTVITESTGEDTGFSIENTNVGLDLASGAVLDEAGNPNPGYTDEMVSDGQDPELLSARFISSTQIEMNFSEEFDLVFPENISLTNDAGVPIGIYGCNPGDPWNIAILNIENIGDDPSFNISNESQGLDLHYFAVTDTAGDPDAGIPPNVNDEVLNIPVGDGIPPFVSAVSILSSNEEDNTIAITGDDINISFTASEPLFETPGVMIAGQLAAVSHDGLFYNATYTVQLSDAAGPVAFSIDYADLAGNVGPQKTSTDDGSSVMIDQGAPPGLALISPVEGFIYDNIFVSFNFTASDDEDEDVDYRLFINGVENTTGDVTCGGYETVDLSLYEGEYNWSVTIWDSTGRCNESSVLNFTVDTEAPELILISPEEGAINETGSVNFTFTASDTVDDTLDYSMFINEIENTNGTIDSGCFENLTVDLEDGEYNWSVTVSDASEKYNESSVLNFTVDTEAPELVLISPEEEFINDTGFVTFNFTAFDIVDEDLDYTLFLNGIENTSGTIVCGDYENVPLSLDEGEYNWSVTVQDSSGKLNESCVLNFTVDTTDPELMLISPEEGAINETGSVNFTFTASDTVDDTLDYTFFINGIENTSGTIDSGCFENLTVDLEDGEYNWSVTVSDASEKYNSSNVLNFTVDTEAPELTLVAPEEGAINNTGSVNLTFSASDNVDELINYTLFINGVENSTGTLSSGLSETVSLDFADGEYSWSVFVWDDAINTNISDVLNFTVDTVAPELTLVAPEEGAINDTGSVNLTFSASDNVDELINYTLLINGEVNRTGYLASGLSETVSLDFADGEYSWSVSVWDDAINTNISDVLNFTVDTVAPELTLVAPEEGAINDTGSVNLTFSASDNVDELINYTLLINGEVNRTGYLASGLSETVSLDFADGEYSWSVSVWDDAINTNISDVLNFTVDTTAPELTLVAPEEGAINNTGSVNLTFSASDNVDELINYTLLINGEVNRTGYLASGLSETVSLDFADGEYSWSVSVWDDAINTNISDVLNFTVDTVAPELTLVAPEEGAINDTGSVNLTFSASDNVDELINYTLLINGEVNRTGYLASGLSETVSLDFADGEYSWSVSVWDDAINTNISDVLNFTVDTTAPELTLVAPEEGAINNTGSVNLTFSASDNVDELINYTLLINGEVNRTGYLASGLSETVSLDFADGEYSWSVSVWDDAINTNISDVLNFTVDTTAPELTLVAPEEGAINDTGSVNLTFSASDNVDELINYTLLINGEVNRTGYLASGLSEVVSLDFADGEYSWSVSVWDDAINTNISDVLNFTVDTVAPELTLVAPEEGAINDTGSVNLTFSASDNVDELINYTLLINGEVNRTGYLASGLSETVSLDFADGEYSWSVSVWDDAINTNISDVLNFTVDTTAPELTLVAPEEGAINNTGSVNLTFSASDNVDELINYTLLINGEVNRTGYLASGLSETVSLDFADGEYSWSVSVWDDAINTNISDVLNFTVDTVAPELTLVAPEEGAINDTGSVNLTFSASDNVDELINYTLLINGEVNRTGYLASGLSETVSLDFADGEYSWSVSVWDDAINTNISDVLNFTVDTTAPELTLVAPEEGAINDTGSVNLTFSASDNVDELINYTLLINGEVNRTGYLASGLSEVVSLDFADGEYNWSVAVRDDAFNANISEVLNFTVDTTAPELALLAPEEGAINDTGSVNLTFSASDNVDELVNYILFINGVENSTGILSSGSSDIVSLNFADGEYNWSVSVWDDALNTNISDVLNFTVDTVAPELTLVAPEDEFINNTGSVTFNFTASDNVDDTLDYTLFVDGEVNRTGSFSSGAYVNVPVSFADGRYNWSLSVWDDAINTGVSEVLNFTVDIVSPGTSVDAPEGKQDAPFWVNFTATDAAPSSGIKSTFYRFEGEEGWTAGDSVYIDVDGVYNISYYSEDFAGNRELAKLVRVELDTSPVLADLQLVPSTILNNSADISVVTVNVTDPSGTGIMNVTIDLSPIGGASDVEMSGSDGSLYTYSLYTYGISTDQVGEFSFNVTATNNNEVNPASTVYLPPLTVIAADDVYSEFGGSDEALSPSEVENAVNGSAVSEGVKYAILSAYFNADGWDLL